MRQRREAQNRVSQLNRCLTLIDEVLALVPTQQEMPRSVRHRVGYYFVEGRYQVSPNRDVSGNVISQTHVLTSCTLPLNGVRIDWKRITKLRSRLAIELEQCGIKYPDQCNIKEERHGNRTLVHEVAWRLCMDSLREVLASLIGIEEGAAAQTNVVSDVLPGPHVRWPDDDRDAEQAKKPDGPDDDRMILVLGGHEFGPFTSTEFDVVKLMWGNRESAWSESNAFFSFHQTLGWSQHRNGNPFGKHQSHIKDAFTRKGFGLPWKRGRGSFVWRGLVPSDEKPARTGSKTRKRSVSRGKKR